MSELKDIDGRGSCEVTQKRESPTRTVRRHLRNLAMTVYADSSPFAVVFVFALVLLLSALLLGCTLDIAIVIAVGEAICVGLVIVIYLNQRSNWPRLPERLQEAVSDGRVPDADQAYRELRDRADQFAPGDYRRATMLATAAWYLDLRGEVNQACSTYEECIAILRPQLYVVPEYFFNCGIGLARLLIQLKRYSLAQEYLNDLAGFVYLAESEATRPVLISYWLIPEYTLLIYEELLLLFVGTGDLPSAREFHSKAQRQFREISTERRGYYDDHFNAVSAWLAIACGDLDAAELRCEQIADRKYVTGLQVRGRLRHLRGQHEAAERSLRLTFKIASRTMNLHHPGFFDSHLDLAEALFGQAKHDDAFASFEEARRMVAHFALPADDAWRKALATWLQRAKDLGRTELAASLQKELAQVSATPLQAITILEKFRIQPPASM